MTEDLTANLVQEQPSVAGILTRYEHDPELVAQLKMSVLADQIIFLLEEQGESQKSLSELMEVSPSVVSRVLHTQPNVTVLTIAKIAQALGTDFAVTIDGTRFPTCHWAGHSSNPEDELFETEYARNRAPTASDAGFGWTLHGRRSGSVATA